LADMYSRYPLVCRNSKLRVSNLGFRIEDLGSRVEG
jgi:hypothetical protein